MPGILDGKVALVTGAGRGLGRAFAEHLASLGAHLAMHGRREDGPAEFGEGASLTATTEHVSKKFGVPAFRVLADLTVPEEVDRAVGEVVQHYGRIDILVHSAGGGPALEINDAIMVADADMQSIMDSNLRSTILLCGRVARDMIPRREGRIITVSSVAALAVEPQGGCHQVHEDACSTNGSAQYQCKLYRPRPYQDWSPSREHQEWFAVSFPQRSNCTRAVYKASGE